MLPVFLESSNSLSMIRHAMLVIKKAIQYTDPQQVPVIAFDQPLFALSKTVQWTWDESLGEDAVVVMLGAFHAEKAAWDMIGDLLDGSGWVHILEMANVST